MLAFVHTETSSVGSLSAAEIEGIAEFASVPAETGRKLHIRLCIQGVFGDGSEGMEIQQRADSGDDWAIVELIEGWAFQDYDAGDPVTDFAGDPQTVAADGGWIDFVLDIPDTAEEVRLHPRYTDGGGSTFQHDIALRSFRWEFDDPPPAVDHEVTPTAPIAWAFALPQASINHGAGTTVDHEVSPTMPISWAFALPQAAVSNQPVQPVVPPPSAMRRWLLSLRLPYRRLPNRWAVMLATSDLVQRLADSTLLALREWWPLTARERSLLIYGAVLTRPRRSGEAVDAWRQRLHLWRAEAVGTTGWVGDEVERITGARRVIDYPRDSMRYDAGRWDVDRWDDGPALVLGATAAQMAELREHLDAELPPDIGLIVLEPGTFDGV